MVLLSPAHIAQGFTVRPTLSADIDLICRHRADMFRASNKPGRTEADLSTMTAHFRSWLAPRLADGRYFGFIVEERGVAVAGIGLMEIDWPPHPDHPTEDKRGYVLNVYVESSHRRRGLARALMDMADTEFKRRGVTYLVLHATRMGKTVYDGTGWKPTSEMSKSFG